jgi:putative membrane protein
MGRVPYRAWMLIVVVALTALSFIHPHAKADIVLEHIPTVLALAALVWMGMRRPLSNRAYTLLAVFFALHALGAHYTYSLVPYNDWTTRLLGFNLNNVLGLDKRNYFDRLVHFSFGLLICPVAAEMAVKFGGIHRGFWAALFGVGFISLFGNLYEVFEWLVSLKMSPEEVENYNGQQGDIWDSQKDLLMSFIGSVVTGVAVWVMGKRRPSSAVAR